jgi:hypothetical protein
MRTVLATRATVSYSRSLLHGLHHITCKIEVKNNFFTLQAGKCWVRGNLECDDVLLVQD